MYKGIIYVGISALVVDLTSFSHMMLFLYMYQCWINSESGEAISLGAIRKNMEYLANASPREARGWVSPELQSSTDKQHSLIILQWDNKKHHTEIFRRRVETNTKMYCWQHLPGRCGTSGIVYMYMCDYSTYPPLLSFSSFEVRELSICPFQMVGSLYVYYVRWGVPYIYIYTYKWPQQRTTVDERIKYAFFVLDNNARLTHSTLTATAVCCYCFYRCWPGLWACIMLVGQ